MPMYHTVNDCWAQHYQQMEVIAKTKPKSRTQTQVMPFDIMHTSVALALGFATLLIAVVL